MQRRARPLLGTVVEIAVDGCAAFDPAFDAISRVHRAMSFHLDSSEVSRLNRDACLHPVRVGDDTYRVLQLALELARVSDGGFDVTVAPELVARGHLPFPAAPAPDPLASSRDIELLPGNRVRFARRLWIDLGGIAKGYAVDLAVAALVDAGATAGLVNAGGDMRAFGARDWTVAIRNPVMPGTAPRLAEFRNMSLATSAWSGSGGPHIDPGRPFAPPVFASVSVLAAACAVADALTKVVMARGREAKPVLEYYGANAIGFEYDGGMIATSDHLLAAQHDRIAA